MLVIFQDREFLKKRTRSNYSIANFGGTNALSRPQNKNSNYRRCHQANGESRSSNDRQWNMKREWSYHENCWEKEKYQSSDCEAIDVRHQRETWDSGIGVKDQGFYIVAVYEKHPFWTGLCTWRYPCSSKLWQVGNCGNCLSLSVSPVCVTNRDTAWIFKPLPHLLKPGRRPSFAHCIAIWEDSELCQPFTWPTILNFKKFPNELLHLRIVMQLHQPHGHGSTSRMTVGVQILYSSFPFYLKICARSWP